MDSNWLYLRAKDSTLGTLRFQKSNEKKKKKCVIYGCIEKLFLYVLIPVWSVSDTRTSFQQTIYEVFAAFHNQTSRSELLLFLSF